jgi:hypothetical protein
MHKYGAINTRHSYCIVPVKRCDRSPCRLQIVHKTLNCVYGIRRIDHVHSIYHEVSDSSNVTATTKYKPHSIYYEVNDSSNVTATTKYKQHPKLLGLNKFPSAITLKPGAEFYFGSFPINRVD